MGFHTFDVGRADELEDPSRFEHCSAEELVGAATWPVSWQKRTCWTVRI